MLICLYFCHRDATNATRLIDWIAELGAGKGHEVFLHWNMRAQQQDMVDAVVTKAGQAFDKVWTLSPYEEDERGWPWSPNLGWQTMARQIANPHERAEPPPQPWLFLEPDAVPTRTTSFTEIFDAYAKCGKPFLGDHVRVEGVSEHLSGIAVYPPTIEDFLRGDGNTPSLIELQGVAWDVFFAKAFLPYSAFTPLIQHVFWHSRKPDVEWHFATEEDFRIVEPETAIFHRDKEGKLIERLRAQKRAGGMVSGLDPAFGRDKAVVVIEPPKTFPFGMGNIANGGPSICAYYEPCVGIDGAEATKLLQLWVKQWHEAGWTPRVLTEADAKQHPMFPVFEQAIAALPTINPPGYERACFMRWLAMAQVGGGFMADYDVMPLGFTPQATPERLTVFQDHNPCPSLVGGTKAEFERICRWFMAWEPTDYDFKYSERGVHVSDMNVLQQSTGKFDVIDAVLNYTANGWSKAKAVHFCSAVMQAHQPRWQHIPMILDTLKPAPEPSEVDVLRAQVERLKQELKGRRPVREKAAPKKKGRTFTEDQKQAMRERLAVARSKKKKLAAA